MEFISRPSSVIYTIDSTAVLDEWKNHVVINNVNDTTTAGQQQQPYLENGVGNTIGGFVIHGPLSPITEEEEDAPKWNEYQVSTLWRRQYQKVRLFYKQEKRAFFCNMV